MKKRRVEEGSLIITDDSGNDILTVKEDFSQGTLFLRVSGRIKSEAAFDFEDELIAGLSVCKRIVIDLSGVTYIAGSALGSIMSAQRIADSKPGAEMIFCNVSDELSKSFEAAGLLKLLTVEGSCAE